MRVARARARAAAPRLECARDAVAAAAGVRALQGDKVGKEQAFLAMTVGWCIEWLQAFFLVADDMMDHSITRRGQPCWYKVPKVGLNACNDCIILEACIYKILKKHAKALPCYPEVRRAGAPRVPATSPQPHTRNRAAAAAAAAGDFPRRDVPDVLRAAD